jgi:hypothetical protein
MKEITVTSQKEFDALPGSFDETTEIHIKTESSIWIIVNKTPDNSCLILWGSSHAVLWGSSHAVLWESSHAELWESSHAVLRGSSHAVLWESSHAEGYQNASLKVQDKTVTIDILKQSAIAICIEKKCTITKKDRSAQVIVCPRVLHSIETFCDIYKANMVGKAAITLYKVTKDNFTDHHSGKIKYAPGATVDCPDWDSNKNRQCGGGLHLSPTVDTALRYHQGKVMKCEVKIKDIVVYGPDITKVRCRRVRVIEEVTNA